MAIEYLAGDRLEETLNIINERLTKLEEYSKARECGLCGRMSKEPFTLYKNRKNIGARLIRVDSWLDGVDDKTYEICKSCAEVEKKWTGDGV